MAIFAVLMPSEQPGLVGAIQTHFPKDHLSVTETQWLISTGGTVIELTEKLGIYDAKNPNTPSTGSAVIFLTSSYYGRAPTNIWDWIRAKLEGTNG